jgi:hypothetical protein
MALNLSKLTKIASYFDQQGKYALADKVENLIKTSQNLLPTLPGEYEPTGAPRTGNPLIDGLFQNMSDTAAGSMFAGLDMFDRFSPFKSKYGPEGASILPTLTPAQFAELNKNKPKLEAGKLILSAPATNPGLEKVFKDLCQFGVFEGNTAVPAPGGSRLNHESSPYTLIDCRTYDFSDADIQNIGQFMKSGQYSFWLPDENTDIVKFQ